MNASNYQPQMKADTERGADRPLGTCRLTLAADHSEVSALHPLWGGRIAKVTTCRGLRASVFHSPYRTRRPLLPACVWSPGVESNLVSASGLKFRCGGRARITQPAFTRIKVIRDLPVCARQSFSEQFRHSSKSFCVSVAYDRNPNQRRPEACSQNPAKRFIQ